MDDLHPAYLAEFHAAAADMLSASQHAKISDTARAKAGRMRKRPATLGADPATDMATISKAEAMQRPCVSLFLPDDMRAKLIAAAPEVDPNSLRIVIANGDDEPADGEGDAIRAIAEQVAESLQPIQARISSVNRRPAGKGMDLLSVSVDSPVLGVLRDLVSQRMSEQGLDDEKRYCWWGDITLGLVPSSVAWSAIPVDPFVLDTLSVTEGTRRDDFAIGIPDDQPDVADQGDGWNVEAPILTSFVSKAEDGEHRLVYSTVYTPNLVDSHGDWAAAEDIEKAAHGFLRDVVRQGAATADVQHSREFVEDVWVVESSIAPVDMEINGCPVRKGSWVIAHEVGHSERAEAIWQGIKSGHLLSVSLDGSAVMEEAACPV